ncbi:MAG: FAD-binding oxidoreductase, partial [Anaerolineae bacterium]|nr:FAD-binding oxidoreductase [Anaerolineae bacterium]
QRLYFHREGEGLLTGQSMPGRPPSFEHTVDADWTAVHLGNAVERMPLLQNARLLAQWAGLYANTPDRQAIIGPAGVEGFYVLSGFSGHGFMHGPIAGQLIAEQVYTGKAETVDISALRYERFTQDSVRETQVV